MRGLRRIVDEKKDELMKNDLMNKLRNKAFSLLGDLDTWFISIDKHKRLLLLLNNEISNYVI